MLDDGRRKKASLKSPGLVQRLFLNKVLHTTAATSATALLPGPADVRADRPLRLPAILGLVFFALGAQPAAAETKSYVVGFVMPAGYAYDGDCKVIDPVTEPGRTSLQSFVRRKLLEAGKTSEEIDKLLDVLDVVDNAIVEPMTFRGKVNGKPVNVLGNPEAVPDPQLHTVTGKYAYGFNLDGKGADDPTSFENPETHEKGVDNQFYRSSGCSKTLRVSYPEMPAAYVDTVLYNAEKVPAVLITVSGKDLSEDGDVTVTFNRAIENNRSDALSKARHDMTFRVDPNPQTHSAFPGRIENGVLHVKGGHIKLQGKFFAAPFDLTGAQLRLKMMPDGSLDGMIGGYQSWRTIYYFYFNTLPASEYGYAIDMPGMYYALRRLADADPDPVTGENRRISITYGIKAVPAFLTESRNGVGQSLASVIGDHDAGTPQATPLGITIQTPAGGGFRFRRYRGHSADSQLLADTNGMTLYTYDNDRSGRPTCYDACAQAWPPLLAPKKAKAFGDWSLAKRRDGRRQWAYLGMPLYRFAKDTVIGEAAGVPKSEEKSKKTPSAAADHPQEPQPQGPWKVASYKLAAPLTPYGVSVAEVGDASGETLLDIAGRTLYTFDGDPNDDQSTCSVRPCASLWMPFAAGRVANPIGDFSIIRRKDGVTQWAYKRKALYRYKDDIEAGTAKGIGVDKRWRVALVKEFYRPPRVFIQESLGRGKVLTDEKGMTLYRRSAALSGGPPRSLPVFPEEGRVIGTGSCDPDCMKTWIPFEASVDAQSTGFWQVVTRSDGKRQWTYKGYALYRYAGDEKPGDVNGTHIFDVVFNVDLKTNLSAVEKAASALKTDGQVALMWSHVYP